MRQIHILLFLACLWAIPTFGQTNSILIPLKQLPGNIRHHGRMETGILSKNIRKFSFDTTSYSIFGVSSIKINYFNKELHSNKLNIFVGIRKDSLQTVMIPDLNFDNNFLNDTTLIFTNTTGMSVDEVNDLEAGLSHIKLQLPIKLSTEDVKREVFLVLTPRTYLSYSVKHPAKNRDDSLYVRASINQHYEGNFTIGTDSVKILLQDLSGDTLTNTIGILNNKNADIKLVSSNEKNRQYNLFIPVGKEIIKFKNEYFTSEILGEFDQLKLNQVASPGQMYGVLPGLKIHNLISMDYGRKMKYSIIDRNKYTLLFFWFVGCGPCHAIIPEIRELSDNFGKKIRVVGICTAGREGEIKDDIQNYNMRWLTLQNLTIDRKEIDKILKIQAYPTFVLVDKYGKIVCRTGEISELKEYIHRRPK